MPETVTPVLLANELPVTPVIANGSAGPVVLTAKANGLLGALVLPAASVAVTV